MIEDGELAGNNGPPLIAMKARFPKRDDLFSQIWDPTEKTYFVHAAIWKTRCDNKRGN